MVKPEVQLLGYGSHRNKIDSEGAIVLHDLTMKAIILTATIAGAMALSACSTPETTTTTSTTKARKVNYASQANVKTINGKRYIWVPGQLGSNMSGHWVLEGSREAETLGVQQATAGTLAGWQGTSGEGQVPEGAKKTQGF